MRICVYGASSNDIDPTYLQAGELLGYEMAGRGHTLVFGGGNQGLMGAVARGMTRGGGVGGSFSRPASRPVSRPSSSRPSGGFGGGRSGGGGMTRGGGSGGSFRGGR